MEADASSAGAVTLALGGKFCGTSSPDERPALPAIGPCDVGTEASAIQDTPPACSPSLHSRFGGPDPSTSFGH